MSPRNFNKWDSAIKQIKNYSLQDGFVILKIFDKNFYILHFLLAPAYVYVDFTLQS